VGEAIAVEVGPGGAAAPRVVVQAGLFAHLDKVSSAVAVALVVEQRQAAPAGQQQGGPAVAVVVVHGGADGVGQGVIDAYGRCRSSPGGNGAPAAVQAGGGGWAVSVAFDGRAGNPGGRASSLPHRGRAGRLPRTKEEATCV